MKIGWSVLSLTFVHLFLLFPLQRPFRAVASVCMLLSIRVSVCALSGSLSERHHTVALTLGP